MKKYIIYIVVLIIGVGVFFLQFGYGRKYQPTTLYQVYLDNEIIGIIKSKDKFESYISSRGEIIKEQVINYNIDVERIKKVEEIINKVITKDNQYYSDYLNITKIKNTYLALNKIVDNNGKLKGNVNELYELYNSLNYKYIEGTQVTDEGIHNYDKLQKNIDKEISELQSKVVDYIYKNKNVLNLTNGEINNIEDYKNIKDITYSKYVYMHEYVDENNVYMYTEDIYEPLGINIKKITTYKNDNYLDEEEVYSKIIERKPCTIEGYQFKIKKSKTVVLTDTVLLGAIANNDYKKVSSNITEDIIVYVTNPKVFNDAIEEITNVFVGSDNYKAYKNSTQEEINDVGSKIENVYLREDITIRETNISTKEQIFNDSSLLASYLIYGDKIETKTIYASSEQSIISLAYENGITIEEFFLSNPSFTSINNIFYDNQPITITKLNPKISLVVDEIQVEEKNIDFKVVEKYDDEMIKGEKKVEQEGVKGLMKVNQKVQKVNGSMNYVQLISKETIKDAQDEIVLVGTKEIPNVGSTTSWGWPTNSGYTLTSYFGWRSYPFNPSAREFHAGLDIAGTGYGSPVYASNNGTIVKMQSDRWNYGTHIILDHNNGYWTTYGHMSGFAKGLKLGDTVSRGQIIGYVGSSGAATGPHLHFEIRVGENRYANVVDPLPYLRKK